MEAFVDVNDEYASYDLTRYVVKDKSGVAKTAVKSLIGDKGVQTLKGLLGK